MRVLLIGTGVVGLRAARQLLSVAAVDDLVLDGRRPEQVGRVIDQLGGIVRGTERRDDERPDVVILAHPPGHGANAAWALARGAHVVSVSDSIDDVEALRALDGQARTAGRSLVLGAGFSPGLTCLLARHAGADFDTVDEIHVAKVGTGGPACARQHHTALAGTGQDWNHGTWVPVRGGSGRELSWFPDPIGGADCYRAALPDALLLHTAFPTARRITARVAATRRDRLTAPLPMMRKPHPEAGAGAVRVEVRGRKDGVASVVVMGAMDRPSVAAGAVAALAAAQALAGALPIGACSLAEVATPAPLLAELARRGVKAARFEGFAERTARS